MKLYFNTKKVDDVVTLETIMKRYIDINGSVDGFEKYVKSGFRNDSGEVEYVTRKDIYIKLEQAYWASYDCTIIWEYVYYGNEMARERICGYYHGKPTKERMKEFAFRGVECTLDIPGIYNI